MRALDKVLRFDGIRAVLASYYSHTGRPSVDPELMLRMMLVGYAYGIRSERGCPRKAACTRQETEVRRLTRHRDEDAREHVRGLQGTDAFKTSARERKKVEMLFAHLKQQFRFRRFKLRGLAGASEECFLAATVQNLRRLVRLRPPDIPQTRLPCAA